jgi:uncharacterized protein (DUF924 family)
MISCALLALRQPWLDWMSLIILLDQLPRNCYRGDMAGIAYHFFDVLA